MSDFKYVSLFAGIGGFDTALDSLGGECVLASEIDKYASQAYELLYGTKPHGDVREINEKDVPDHDVLAFGFPCQSFSISGKRLGFEDMRGTLFFEAARIAKEKQPKILFGENVKGLISHNKGETLKVILHFMNQIGYLVDFEVVNSKHHHVPQSRERIFLIGIRKDLIEQEDWIIEKGRNDSVAKAKKQMMKEGTYKTFNFDFPDSKIVTKRLKDILETDVDEKYYLSQDRVDKLILKKKENEKNRSENIEVIGNLDIKGNDSIKRVYHPEGQSPSLTTMQGGGREPKILEEKERVREWDEDENKVFARRHDERNKGRVCEEHVYYKEDGICGTLTVSLQKNVIVEEPTIQVEGNIYKEGSQNGRVYNENGLCPSLSVSNADELRIKKEPKIIIHNLAQTVRIRKHEVDTKSLVPLLREKKKSSGLTNKGIAERVNKPLSLVEHWFRNDSSFAIPTEDVWFILKDLLQIDTDEFDAQITEFIEKDGEFEKTQRCYDVEGLAPTLTSTSADEKIVEQEVEIGNQSHEKTVEPFNTAKDDVSFALTTRTMACYLPVHVEKKQASLIQETTNKVRVRKLTPKECFRLQGFSDEAHDLLKENGISDSQRYKMAGNAVTVNVIKAIGEKLLPYLKK